MTITYFDALPVWAAQELNALGHTSNLGGAPVWSGKQAPPAIGERVKIRVNAIGAGVVTGYFVQEGFLGVLVALESAPAWYVQNNGGDVPCHSFGTEVEPIAAEPAPAEYTFGEPIEAPAPVILTPGQFVTVTGWARAYHFNTARGYAIESGRDPEAAHARALGFGHDTAWTVNAGSMITDSRAANLARAQEAADALASAVILADGQTVEIEGERYSVKVIGERYSDPIHFRRA